MLPTRKNQGWLPSIFNDFFDNDWMEKANATAPAINVVEHENDYCIDCLLYTSPSPRDS